MTPPPTTSPTTSETTLAKSWYPNLRGRHHTCLNDGNAPYYMRISATYYQSSLDACCERYFSWDIPTCTGGSGTPPGVFYPNYGGSETKCLNRTERVETMPNYMRRNLEKWLEDDIESCCGKYYKWAYSDCISLSGNIPFAPATRKWYANQLADICQQDCPEEGGGSCGGFAKPWDALYETPTACCAEEISWIVSPACEARSTIS
mmetsp:Transcript_8201/g.14313  ORF Transcript_8201/g.14313 Transcript_8201/m.14313 type:complete len:205 (-) Transcript_8201:518-1132(-)